MAAPSAALSISGATHTNASGCRSNKSKGNWNNFRVAFASSFIKTGRCAKLTTCRAQSEDSKGGGGFLTGFLIGGAIFGTLGYIFAPQISRTLDSLLDENGQDSDSDETGLQRVPRNGRYYDEGLEKTRQTLGDKISQLNSAIDKAATRLKRVTGNVENEPANDETEIGEEHVVENVNDHGFVQGESTT